MKKNTMLLVLSVAFVATSVCVAGDWNQFRGPDRNGKFTEGGLMTSWPAGGPKILWSWQGLGKGYASMSVVDGIIYTTGVEGKTCYIYAFNLEGKPVWKESCGPGWTGSWEGSRTTPTIDSGKLYAMSGNGMMICLNAKTGKRVWEVDTAKKFGAKNIRWGISESVLIDGSKVICTPGGADATVVALDKTTGTTIWTSKGLSEKSAYCCPMIIEEGGNRFVLTMVEKSVVCLDVETGKLIWQIPYPTKYDIAAVTPVYAGGVLYTTTSYGYGGTGFAMSDNFTKWQKKWIDKTLDCHHGGVINIGNDIFGSNGREWVCLDIVTGKVKYTEKLVGKGCVIYVDGLFYCYGERDGTLALVKADNNGFKEISSFKIELGTDKHWAHPVVSDGVLYVRHGDTIMAYDIKAK